MKTRFYFFAVLIIFSLSYPFSLTSQVSTGTLLQEMTDLKTLAEYPDPAFTTTQFSSYDRHSISPDHPGWFDNSDGFGGESIPGFEAVLEEPRENGIGRYLICDVKGPGAMVRIWTAWITGKFEVYLDGSDDPLYDGPAQDFIYNTYDAIAGTEGQYNSDEVFFQNTAGYYPIPFQDGFRLIYEGKIDELHFYHLQVRMYPERTEVISFSKEDLEAYNDDIAEVSYAFLDPRWFQIGKTAITEEFENTITSGNEMQIHDIQGENAIMWLKIKVEADDIDKALRQNILKIYFDGASAAQVQSPIGDFFGAAPGINPYKSLPMKVFSDSGMLSIFYMPFKDSVDIKIENLGEQDIKIWSEVIYEPYQWNENSMYFRARWRIDHGLFASYRPSQDIPYLFANGQGVMVGAAAYLYNPTSVPSSWGNWWGEGDEKIYIDMSAFPDFFGTGSEDYYNYAWSSSAIFTHPYCGQPRNDGPANRGFVTNYRWHVLDKIPFNTGLTFYMELMSHEPVEDFSYGRMVYLYAKPGMYDDHLPITKEDVRTIEQPKNWQAVGRKGSNNAIFIQAEKLVANPDEFSYDHGPLWSGDKMLVWEPGSKKDELLLNIPIEDDGEYTLVMTLGKDNEGGQFNVMQDGEVIEFRGSTEINLHDRYRVLSRNYRSAPLQLKQGNNEFIINTADGNSGKFKLDFIWLMAR